MSKTLNNNGFKVTCECAGPNQIFFSSVLYENIYCVVDKELQKARFQWFVIVPYFDNIATKSKKRILCGISLL